MHMRACIVSCAVFLCGCAAADGVRDPSAARGMDFINEARFINRVVLCSDDPLPEGVDGRMVDEHCRTVSARIDAYRGGFVREAMPFIAAWRPAKAPAAVVYPFGGCDLVTALVTYPGAGEYITISLESAGDPRRIVKSGGAVLRASLERFRGLLAYHLDTHDSTNDNVRLSDEGLVPGQIAFSLAAARVFGCEPVSMRFFRIGEGGAIDYLTAGDITALENTKGGRLSWSWNNTDFSVAFRNVEIIYRPAGGVQGRGFVHRHIAANLDNAHFAGSGLQRYLESRGRMSVMTKAGSYLLWMDGFSALREYLLTRMDFMVSDSTGILPRHAAAAGFEQVTFGAFYGAFLDNEGGKDAEELRALFRSQPARELPFRYGYSDVRRSNHLIITRPKKKGR
jgi:hypothetical protein